MPFDEDGNFIPEEDDQEEGQLDTEGAPATSDMAEYLRRANLQSQMASAGGGTAVATAPSEYRAPVIGPEEERFRRLEHEAPIKANFHPSGLRKGLGILGGIATGIATQDPNAAAAQRSAITDRGFNKAQSDFQQKLQIQQNLAQEEEAATQRANTAAHIGAQTEAEKARREAEAARGARYQWMISPEGQKFELDKARLTHPGTAPKAEEGPYEAELNDGSTVDLVRTNAGLWKNPETGELIQRSAIKKISEKGKSIKDSSQFSGVLKEDVAAHQVLAEETAKPGTHQPYEVDAAKAYIKARAEGRDPQSAFASAQRALEDEKGRKLTSNEIVQLQNKLQPIQKPPQALGVTPEGEAIRIAPGSRVPEGTVTAGGMSTEAVQGNKQKIDEQRALAENQKAYGLAQQFAKQETGPGDVALVMQFMGAVKPESIGKIRFNKGEQDFIIHARDSLGDLNGLLQKVSGGGKLTPPQRKQMLDTMRIMADPTVAHEAGAPNTPSVGLPKVGEQFEGSRVKSIKQIK